MDLEILGWDDFFADSFAPYARDNYLAGRVALDCSGIYRLYTEIGEWEAELSGKLRYRAESREALPVVGDWVALRPREQNKAIIDAVLPRKTKFSRKVTGQRIEEQLVATNIDTLFLVSGLDQDFNPRRIERYLIMAKASGSNPVIVLNKADICQDRDAKLHQVRDIASTVAILLVSAKQGEGLDMLMPFVNKGQTAALVGSSGVGKSTIINKLLGEERQKVGLVRENDDRGKHTTTHRELFILPDHGLIIDTPGLRELQLWFSQTGLQDAFSDITALAEQCYFTNCQHQDQPGCAIKEALENGQLSPERLDNYWKMLDELRQLSEKQSLKSAYLEKQRSKKGSQPIKKFKK
ncbi:MAG: ribosome small subunit-dependent GTPase A [Acidobacteriota bacterium]